MKISATEINQFLDRNGREADTKIDTGNHFGIKGKNTPAKKIASKGKVGLFFIPDAEFSKFVVKHEDTTHGMVCCPAPERAAEVFNNA